MAYNNASRGFARQNFSPRNSGGFIGRVVLVLVALFIVATYFNVDIKEKVDAFAQSPVTKKNTSYVVGLGKSLWSGYLEQPARHFWSNIVSNLIKDSFKQNFENVKALRDGNYDALKLTPVFPVNLIPTVGECGTYC